MLQPTLSLFLLRELPFPRFAFPRWQSWLALLILGAGYGFDKGNTLNATFKANASGDNGAEFRVNWLYTFR